MALSASQNSSSVLLRANVPFSKRDGSTVSGCVSVLASSIYEWGWVSLTIVALRKGHAGAYMHLWQCPILCKLQVRRRSSPTCNQHGGGYVIPCVSRGQFTNGYCIDFYYLKQKSALPHLPPTLVLSTFHGTFFQHGKGGVQRHGCATREVVLAPTRASTRPTIRDISKI